MGDVSAIVSNGTACWALPSPMNLQSAKVTQFDKALIAGLIQEQPMVGAG